MEILTERTSSTSKETVRRSLMEVMLSSYQVLYYIDLIKGDTLLLHGDEAAKLFKPVFEAKTDVDLIKRFNSDYVNVVIAEEDRERVSRVMSVENIYHALETDGSITVTYRARRNLVDMVYTQMRIYKVRETEGKTSAIVVAFKVADKEIRETMEEKEDLIRGKLFTGLMMATFMSAYYVDLENNSFEIFRQRDFKADEYNDPADYAGTARRYFTEATPPEDSAKLLWLADLEKVRAWAQNVTTYTESFLDIGYPEPRYTKIFVSAAGDGRHIAVGFADVDEEIRAERERELREAIVMDLAADFDMVQYVELKPDKKDDIVLFDRTSEELLNLLPKFDRQTTFKQRLDDFAQAIVYKDDRADFIAKTRREIIMENLAKNPAYFVNFRAVLRKGRTWYYQAKFSLHRDPNGNAKGLISGIHSTDIETRKELDIRSRIEKTVALQTAELRKRSEAIGRMNEGMIELLAEVVESRDPESGTHVHKVKAFTHVLATQVMRDLPQYGLNEQTVRLITLAAPLHDVGKIFIPDSILLKPGKLTPAEFDVIKSHCRLGVEFLKKVPKDWGADYMKMSEEICLYHHERWTGHGYPMGLAGDAIPIAAQIVGIADCFDALISGDRPYKDAYDPVVAFEMIREGQCGEFSPRLMDCFFACREQFLNLALNRKMREIENTGFEYYSDKTNLKLLKNLNILVADDSELNLEMTAAILEEAGAHVVTATNGREAVEAFARVQDIAFDAIIMDVVMPVLDGLDATRLIRGMDKYRAATIPIIGYTASLSENDFSLCMEVGMNATVHKPLDINALAVVLLQSMQREAELLRDQLDSARRQANVDVLTGVKNMKAYTEKMVQLSAQMGETNAEGFAIVAFDVNDLKGANDNFGHAMGDVYLKNCCRIICRTFKHSPVYRTGGDEFIAVLAGDDFANREDLLHEFRENIMVAEKLNDIRQGKASVAAGIAEFVPGSGEELKDLLERADKAMYKEKKAMKFNH